MRCRACRFPPPPITPLSHPLSSCSTCHASPPPRPPPRLACPAKLHLLPPPVVRLCVLGCSTIFCADCKRVPYHKGTTCAQFAEIEKVTSLACLCNCLVRSQARSCRFCSDKLSESNIAKVHWHRPPCPINRRHHRPALHPLISISWCMFCKTVVCVGFIAGCAWPRPEGCVHQGRLHGEAQGLLQPRVGVWLLLQRRAGRGGGRLPAMPQGRLACLCGGASVVGSTIWTILAMSSARSAMLKLLKTRPACRCSCRRVCATAAVCVCVCVHRSEMSAIMCSTTSVW